MHWSSLLPQLEDVKLSVLAYYAVFQLKSFKNDECMNVHYDVADCEFSKSVSSFNIDRRTAERKVL